MGYKFNSAGPDYGMSLRKVRIWYAPEEEETPNNSEENKQEPPKKTNQEVPKQKVEELPAWAQELITGLRQEAAERRVKNKGLEDQLNLISEQLNTIVPKKPEGESDLSEPKKDGEQRNVIADLNQLVSQVGNLKIQNLKLQVALEKGLPPALAERLVGQTLDELQSDAQTFLSLIQSSSPTSDESPEEDKKKDVKKTKSPAAPSGEDSAVMTDEMRRGIYFGGQTKNVGLFKTDSS